MRPTRNLPALCTGVLVVALLGRATLGSLPLNPVDTGFTLDWGHELLHGHVPDVRVNGAATPHPLSIAFGAFAASAGGGALDAMQDLLTIAAGAVVVALVAIGRTVRSPLIGVAAAVILVGSGQFLFTNLALATPSDLPALAAVLAALALELERPRRGYAPLGLLALAGLWRPEVWLLSAAYAIYCVAADTPARPRNLAFLVALAPAIWAVSDLVLTGDPLYSLTYTRWAAAAVSRPTGVSAVPGVLWVTLSEYFSTPMLLAAGAGLAIDLRTGMLPRVIPMWLALAVAGFTATGAAALPVLGRYALPVVVATALYCGFFVVGWWRVERGWVRRVWGLAAASLAVLLIAGAPGRIDHLSSERVQVDELGRFDRALGSLTSSPRVKLLIARCPPLQTSYQIVPLLAFDLGTSPQAITWVNEGIPGGGTVVEPARSQSLFEAPSYPARSFVEHGYALVAANRYWLAFTQCSCTRERHRARAPLARRYDGVPS
ncbi:MAG TPA: hypothetical protein VK272_10350 [Solirubrobacteraceae bacterium]|nr:hypothetical protein [Solirubrobacteraceae bacterium]